MADATTSMARCGHLVPDVALGRLVGDTVRSARLRRLVAGKRAALIGVPGAFTPTCTRTHIPGFLEQAEALKRVRFDLVMCIAPNDPWTVAAWAKQLDPEGRIAFLSDGNMDLARALGAMRSDRAQFLGDRSSRYLVVVNDGVIEHLKVEPSLNVLTCTRAEDALALAS